MEEEINHLAFNSNYSVFVMSTNKGFKIYRSSDNSPQKSRAVDGGVKLALILDVTNIIVYVANNTPSVLTIWDEHKGTIIGIKECKEPILDAKITRKHVAIVHKNYITLYDLQDNLKELKEIKTYNNDNVICYLTDKYLICPGSDQGIVNIITLSDMSSKEIKSHFSALTCVNITSDQKQLVTASDQGTLIRLFDINNGEKLREYRRGASAGRVYNCVLDKDANFLCVTSDKGTIHIYNLSDNDQNYRSAISALSIVSKYFDSTWSSMKLTDSNIICMKHICCFDEKMNNIYVITYNGTITSYAFDLKTKNIIKGETRLIEFNSGISQSK